MTKRTPHYEIVRSDGGQPFRARLVAGNGEITWWTEHYTRKSSAKRAIRAHTMAVLQAGREALLRHSEFFVGDMKTDFQLAAEKLVSKDLAVSLPIHEIDERS